MDLDSRQLRYVLQVASDLNFTRAARQLHVAQQTLSESVNQLERQLGVQLFERSPQRVELTPAGHAFVEHAAQLLVQVESTITATRAAARAAQRTVVTGSPDWPSGIDLFRTGIDLHRRRHPDLNVVLDPAPWIEHIDAVLRRRIDLGVTIITGPDDLPDGIEAVPLIADSAGFVFAADDHPLTGLARVTVADAANYPMLFIARDDHPRLHDALAGHLRSHGITAAADANRTTSFASAVSHSMVGDSLVWVSASMASNPPQGLRSIRVDGLELPITLVAIHRTGDDRAAALAASIAAGEERPPRI